jgi:hypothetical protein
MIHFTQYLAIYFSLYMFALFFLYVNYILKPEDTNKSSKTYYFYCTNYFGFVSEDYIKYILEYVLQYILPELCFLHRSKYILITLASKIEDSITPISYECGFYFNSRDPNISVEDLFKLIEWIDFHNIQQESDIVVKIEIL